MEHTDRVKEELGVNNRWSIGFIPPGVATGGGQDGSLSQIGGCGGGGGGGGPLPRDPPAATAAEEIVAAAEAGLLRFSRED